MDYYLVFVIACCLLLAAELLFCMLFILTTGVVWSLFCLERVKSEFRQWPTPSSCLVSQPTKISSDTIYVIVLSITSMLFLFTSTFFDFRCLGIFLALFPFFFTCCCFLFCSFYCFFFFFFSNLCFFLVGIKVAYNQVSSVYDLEQLLLFLNQCNEPLSFI